MTPPPRTLDDFLTATGWPKPSPIHRARMKQVFEYLQRVVGPAELNVSEADSRHGAGPWACKIDGRATRLCNFMQAINFDEPVDPHFQLKKDMTLKCFRESHGLRGAPASGNWYAEATRTTERTRHQARPVHRALVQGPSPCDRVAHQGG